jgi:hypothetical protein
VQRESPDLAGIHESEEGYASWVGLYLKGIEGARNAEGYRDAGLQIGITCCVIGERAVIGCPSEGASIERPTLLIR